MLVLAADTTTPVLSVALCRDEALVGEATFECGRAHSERLLDTTRWLLGQAGAALGDVDVFAVAAGPGSFTGVRIGMAAWKGLALGAGRPLCAVPTLDALARAVARPDGVVCTLLDARMNEVFGAIYRFDGGMRTKLAEDTVGPAQGLVAQLDGPVVFVGDGAQRYWAEIAAALPEAVLAPAALFGPRATAVAQEARERLAEHGALHPAHADATYLRQSQAEINRARHACS